MGVNRIQQPWGFQDENRFQGGVASFDNILDSFFFDAKYDSETNIVDFYGRDGEKVASIDLSDLRTSDLIKDAKYVNGDLIITFSNDQTTVIDLSELIDQNEFSDGFEVDENGVVMLVIDPSGDKTSEGEPYLTVGEDGIKLSGVNDAISEAVSSSESSLMEKVKKMLDDLKTHEHSVEDITDIAKDASGVVLGIEYTGGTVSLVAGQF